MSFLSATGGVRVKWVMHDILLKRARVKDRYKEERKGDCFQPKIEVFGETREMARVEKVRGWWRSCFCARSQGSQQKDGDRLTYIKNITKMLSSQNESFDIWWTIPWHTSGPLLSRTLRGSLLTSSLASSSTVSTNCRRDISNHRCKSNLGWNFP